MSCMSFINFFDRAGHVEVLLGNMVAFAIQDAGKTFDRIFAFNELPWRTSKLFGNVKVLSQELLDFTRAINGLFIFFRELVHTENRDHILQLFITLKIALNACCNIIMIFANDRLGERRSA